MEVNYQSRYLAYCKAKGIEPGTYFRSWDYMAWIADQLQVFNEQFGYKGLYTEERHNQFTKWLLEEVS